MDLNIASICELMASRRPDSDCLIFRDRRFTWAQVRDRTSRLASVLAAAGLGRSSHGPRRGAEDVEKLDPLELASAQDRVALYLLNGNEYLEGMLGSWKAGCVPFNVNYRYVAQELEYILVDSSPRAIIVHERFTPILEGVLATLETRPELILTVADGSGCRGVRGSLDYEEALAAASPALPASLSDSWSGDDAYLCYTGGTTGMPKGAIWRQGDFLVSALGLGRSDGTEFEEVAEVVAASRGTVRALPAPPLMHGAAHWNAISCWMAGGAVIIQDVVDHFEPVDIISTIERHRATSLLIVGDPMARPLVDALIVERRSGIVRDLSSLRHILSGGAVLSPAIKGELVELLPRVKIVDVLGSTESGRQGISRSRLGDTEVDFTASDATVVLSKDLSRRLSAGDPELGWLAQSGRVPLGYLNDPEKSARTFPVVAGVRYALPGDRASITPEGKLELHGRDSVCINTGGEKVFAEEVETALRSHPSVLDCVVCGQPSERFGQEVVAIIRLREGHGPSDEELLASAAAHVARYKLPRRILRREEIMRSPSGKADYRWAYAQARTADDPS